MANLSNINNYFVVDTAGQVAIGDVSSATLPTLQTQLTVYDHTGTAGVIIQSGGASGKKYELFSNASGTFGISDIGVGDRLTISSGGDATFSGTITSGALTVGTSGTSRFTDTSAFPLQLNRGLAVDVVGTAGTIFGLGAYSTGTTYIDAVRIIGVLDANGTDGDMQLQVLNSGTHTTALTLNNNNNATFLGNVTLNQYLEISSTTAQYAYMNFGASAGYGWQIGKAPATGGVVDDQGFYLYNLNTGYQDVNLAVLKSGNVGIGTTTPVTLLQVGEAPTSSSQQGARIYGFDGALSLYTTRSESNFNTALYLYNDPTGSAVGTGTGIMFRANSDTTSGQQQATVYSNWTTSTHASRTAKLVFQTCNAGTVSDKMTILGNGNVGIGTTLPTTALTIRKAIPAAASSYGLQASMVEFKSYYPGYDTETVKSAIYSGVSDQTTLQTTKGFMSFWTSSEISPAGQNLTEKMRIEANGFVGIGTTSPNKALTVYGGNDNGIWIDSQGAQYTSLAFGNNGTEKANIAWDNTNAYTNITTYGNGHLALSTGGRISAFLNSTGNFGVGDTAPTSISVNTYSLSVNSGRNDLSGALVAKANGNIKHQQYWDSSGYGFNITANSGVFKFGGADVQVNANIKANDIDGKFYSMVASWAYVASKNDLFSFAGTEGAVWEYTIKMNPNSAGSGAYRDFYYGKLGIGIGWSGSALTQYIWQQQDQTAPRTLYGSGGGNFNPLFRMYYSGGVYTELALNTAWTLRIQGLSTSTTGDIIFRKLA